MRDWLIDCAVRWQRRNKLLVPKSGTQPTAAAAVIGPRDAALKAAMPAVPASEPETPAMAEAPMEQVWTVPVAVAEPPAPVVESLAVEEAPVAEEVPVEEVPVEEAEAPEAEAPAAEEPGVEEPVAEETAPEVAEAVVAETPAPEVPAPPAVETAATKVVPSAPAPAPVQRPLADLSRMTAWQVMVLSGPAGTGKSSIAQQFCEMLPKAAHIKVEPLRDNAYSVLVAQPMSREGVDDGAKAEVWTGKTDEARQQAIDLAKAYTHLGYYVIIDDVLELPPEVSFYQEGLDGLTIRTFTLMPALEEMERRDKYRPAELQAGPRIKELYQTMTRQLGSLSTVLDTSSETVPETVKRILGLLEE